MHGATTVRQGAGRARVGGGCALVALLCAAAPLAAVRPAAAQRAAAPAPRSTATRGTPGPTAAGTPIVSTTTLRHDGGSLVSNVVTTLVAERLDLVLEEPSLTPDGGELTLVNPGNGQEAFALVAELHRPASGEARPVAVTIDGAVLTDGRTPAVPAGGRLRLHLPLDVAARAGGGELVVVASAVTGSGAPGLAFDRHGDGQSDAVVGASGAAARAVLSLAAPAPPTSPRDPGPPPTVTIEQAVLAPDGGTTPMRGATVTYTLVARFAAAVTAAALDDAVPAGTVYRPGSLVLDGAPLPDAGHVADGRIVVPLGAADAGTSRRLSFQVVIS